MKGRAISYSAAELAWLEANCTLVISEYAASFRETFGRDVSLLNLHALRVRRRWRTGRTGRIEKGATAYNKGVKCEPGTRGHHPNARATQFKAGCRTGRAHQNYKPIGTERVNDEGYREIKVNDDRSFSRRWALVHRIKWEAAHGPVPNGMVLRCKGDRLVTDPANWDLVPRAILPRLNGGRHRSFMIYDDAPNEVKPALLAVARLDHAIRHRAPASAQEPSDAA